MNGIFRAAVTPAFFLRHEAGSGSPSRSNRARRVVHPLDEHRRWMPKENERELELNGMSRQLHRGQIGEAHGEGAREGRSGPRRTKSARPSRLPPRSVSVSEGREWRQARDARSQKMQTTIYAVRRRGERNRGAYRRRVESKDCC